MIKKHTHHYKLLVILRAQNEGTNLEVLIPEDYWTYEGEVIGYDSIADIGVNFNQTRQRRMEIF